MATVDESKVNGSYGESSLKPSRCLVISFTKAFFASGTMQ